MENLLITGGAGFIGSNFLHYMVRKYPNKQFVNVDALTYAGSYDSVEELEGLPNYTFINEDICNKEKMQEIIDGYGIDTVVNFAAETHVDRSIENSDAFFRSNVLGTKSLLDVCMKSWKLDPSDFNDRRFRAGVRFLQISTDEVYGALGKEGYFTEETPLHPNSPYSASKASADMMVSAYHHTYGLPVNITRCSNNYGPYQYPEKLIPLMTTYALDDRKLPVYGDGQQIRDWLFVTDHCTAVESVLLNGRDGEIYNVGGDSEKTNEEVVKVILDTLGKDHSLIAYVKDRPGHDRRYAIDHSKITRELGWQPSVTFEEGIQETIDYYVRTVQLQN
ncbi:dTDP-glucose 4,6-dehydratase [Alkalibacterium pelagium]|uniref:dTDP-glucose 4,6-dehydratase n=1 Tax=Alkalibacterium pelagium TaxID=426702 RepID=A0A1H7HQ87_9LACT|nr:dTDP-glucose 4,6-dehydratase [Alkalibacterium pelagium]GEN50395.1 dTDP-glucose 4,6-dehydratase [Alkalibacterium pelagium]SEK51672.1 dTDP-glucose 4,6-dehydratase [Alkalibacterium pelagium]